MLLTGPLYLLLSAALITSKPLAIRQESALCFDHSEDCSSKVNLCNDTFQGLQTRFECPETCFGCIETPSSPFPASCIDVFPGACVAQAHLCKSSTYATVMRVTCPRTCNTCPLTPGPPPPGPCVDSSLRCGDWNRNGFCESTFYTVAQKKAYCMNTCKLC